MLQYPSFYDGLKLSASAFIIDTMRDLNPAYISSPEIGFLKGLVGKVNPAKLIFKIPGINEVEPTTKKTYVTLLSDINMIKTFASGIILPKDSIWPVDSGRLLLPATSSVSDFHKAGLEVYASGFANDDYLSYNYSYDPTKEYLQFIDNSQFSVDGVITDFPATASESIGEIMLFLSSIPIIYFSMSQKEEYCKTYQKVKLTETVSKFYISFLPWFYMI